MRKTLLLIWTIFIGQTLFGQNDDNYWKPNVNAYPTNMSVIAVVSLSGEEQRNEMIELGAFYSSDNELNGELRGSKRLIHIETQNGAIDRYIAYITIYGNAGDIITFKLYSHELGMELDYITEQSITFVVDGTLGSNEFPLVLDFAKYVTTDEMLAEVSSSDDIIIGGNVNVYNGNDITAKSLKIEDNKSLTIQDGGTLTVNETIVNTDVNALIIEEGGQIFQTNDNVAATFRNEIVVPTGIWGEEDETGWQFISSPIANVNTNDFIPESGDYDLYIYDGTNEYQWQNFKQMGTLSYDFSSNPFNDGWTSIDADGDGRNWTYQTRSKYVYSVTYDDIYEDIFAENYLVSPLISINNGTMLTFKARCTDNEYYPETFKVLLSENSNSNSSDFTIELNDYTVTNTSFDTYTIDLSEYAGQNVYVAFYHYVAPENSGSAQLIIDDVEFVNENSFEKGKGYLVSYENEDNVAEFKGNLNYLAEGESFQINLNHYPDNNLAQFHLIGNPFPFNVNWDTDINVNNVYNGFATLDATNGGYVYKEESETIKSGEGFMVKTMEGNENYVAISKGVSKSYRKGNNSINITASNTKGSDNVIIKFNDEKQSGFPKLANFNDKIANVYVKDEDVNYGIYNYNSDINEIPLYFDAKEIGNYTLTFNVKGNYEYLYLIDKMTGEKVNLLLENEYKFMANSNDNNDRFIISFDNSQQTTDNSQFAYISNGEIIITNVSADTQINIYDALGRCIFRRDAACHVRTSTDGFDSGMYIIQKIDNNGVKVQKIVL